MVKKNGVVDKAILGELTDKYAVIKKLKPNIICLGYDQKAFTEGLKNFNIRVIKLKSFKPKIYKSSKIN
jgi:glycerol-3-phosphate cytidylyltransferase-like family protein